MFYMLLNDFCYQSKISSFGIFCMLWVPKCSLGWITFYKYLMLLLLFLEFSACFGSRNVLLGGSLFTSISCCWCFFCRGGGGTSIDIISLTWKSGLTPSLKWILSTHEWNKLVYSYMSTYQAYPRKSYKNIFV